MRRSSDRILTTHDNLATPNFGGTSGLKGLRGIMHLIRQLEWRFALEAANRSRLLAG
jgi:hypothetical protein